MASEEIQLNQLDELACLLVPTYGKNLILPNVSVAEIVGYLHPVAESKSPDWFLGMVNWRGQQVPLLSYEELNGEPKPIGSVENRLAILNTTGVNEDLTWIGIVTKITPHLVRVAADEINHVEGDKLGPMELMSVNVNGEDAVIPNLDLLQEKYLEFRNKKK